MQVVDPLDRFRIGFDARQVEIDYDRLLAAAHQHARQRRLVAGVDLLVRDEGRHVDEIARGGFGHEFEPVTPAHAGASADHIDDAFDRPMVVRPGLGFGVDNDGSSPQLLRSRAGVGDGRRAIHAGRLSRVDVEFVRMDDADAVEAPSGVAAFVHGYFSPTYSRGADFPAIYRESGRSDSAPHSAAPLDGWRWRTPRPKLRS